MCLFVLVCTTHITILKYTGNATSSLKEETVTIVGNICETGDIIAKDRKLPEIIENDILGVLDSGAYGYQ